MVAQEYNIRPETVEAVRLTVDNVKEVAQWCGGEVITVRDDPDLLIVPGTTRGLRAGEGMYIVRSKETGRFFVMTEDNFETKYVSDKVIEEPKRLANGFPAVYPRSEPRPASDQYFGIGGFGTPFGE